ncbi:MAG TPA: hypothetical protein VIK91_19830 [Nannocystis sp.]
MRPRVLALAGILLLFACTYESQGLTGPATGTSTTGGSTSALDPTTTAASTCVPGMSIACACPNSAMGAQICNPDGKSYGPCVCEGTGDSEGGTTTTGTTGALDVTTDSDIPATSTGTTTGDTGDTTTGDACPDPGPEPNDVEAQAVDLGDQTCSEQPAQFTGVLDGPSDVDWYRYHGIYQDCGGISPPDPDATHKLKAGATVRLCVFATCDDGELDLECDGPLTQSLSPEGRPGCCHKGDVTFTVSCEDGDFENAHLFIRLDQAPADACVGYTVTYSYTAN